MNAQLSRAVSTWVDREKKLNVILQCSPAEHITASTRIVHEVKSGFSLLPCIIEAKSMSTVVQQKKKLMKDLAVLMAQSLVSQGHKFIDVHRDDVDMSFLQTLAKAAQVIDTRTPSSLINIELILGSRVPVRVGLVSKLQRGRGRPVHLVWPQGARRSDQQADRGTITGKGRRTRQHFPGPCSHLQASQRGH